MRAGRFRVIEDADRRATQRIAQRMLGGGHPATRHYFAAPNLKIRSPLVALNANRSAQGDQQSLTAATSATRQRVPVNTAHLLLFANRYPSCRQKPYVTHRAAIKAAKAASALIRLMR
jgi:hypothetical protein